VTVGALAATNAFALPSDRFRWSINTNMFHPPEAASGDRVQDGGPLRVPRRGTVGQPDAEAARPAARGFQKLLDEAGIGISSIASDGEYFDTSKLQATLDDHAKNARFGAYFGIKALKANLNNRLGPENLSAANARILAKNLNEVGKRTLEHGVKFAFSSPRLDDGRAQGRNRDDSGDDRPQSSSS
jgi:hypothetical protein